MATPQLLTFFKAFTTDAHGRIPLTGIVDVKEYRQVDLEIVQQPGAVANITVGVSMGKLSGSTLSQRVGTFALGPATIRTFNVVGPEVAVTLTGGPPNTVVNIQAWLFLH